MAISKELLALCAENEIILEVEAGVVGGEEDGIDHSDMPADKLGPYMEAVQKVAQAVEAALTPDGLVVTQFNGAPAGQTVYHLHFHIIPRWKDVALGRHGSGEMADTAKLGVLADRIKSKL